MQLSGQRDFAVRLALEVARSPGNFCLSPYSIWANLATLDSGAGGATKRKLKKLLGLGRQEQHHLRDRAYESLDSKVELKIVNSLWRQVGVDFDGNVSAPPESPPRSAGTSPLRAQ